MFQNLSCDETSAIICTPLSPVAQSVRAAVKFAMDAGDGVVMANYSSVLECLLRLRQVCCCPSLVLPSRIQAAQRMLDQLTVHREAAKKVSPEDAKKLFEVLKQVCDWFECEFNCVYIQYLETIVHKRN